MRAPREARTEAALELSWGIADSSAALVTGERTQENRGERANEVAVLETGHLSHTAERE